jgi:hypothetical protein
VHGARGWAVIYEPVEAVAVVSGKGLPFAGDGAIGGVEERARLMRSGWGIIVGGAIDHHGLG